MNNIQISIQNIHIRYENESEYMQPSMGLTISNLCAVSTDKNWNEDHFSLDSNEIYKLLRMDSLGTYCCTNNETAWLKCTDEELVELFLCGIKSSKNLDLNSQYFVHPVSGIGKLIYVKTFDPKRPTYTLNLEFDELALNLDNYQFSSFIDIFLTISRRRRAWKYRKHRPPKTITPKLDPMVWLQYAINCVREDISLKSYTWSWAYFQSRRDDRIAYIRLYKL